MPIDPRRRSNNDWEGNAASVALAGVRPLVQNTVAVGAGAAGEYQMTHAAARRVVVFHDSGTNTDIRIDAGASAATANSMPLASGVYFVLELVEDEYVRFFNTAAGSITVNVMEIQ